MDVSTLSEHVASSHVPEASVATARHAPMTTVAKWKRMKKTKREIYNGDDDKEE